jgi:hypothetical protein
MEQCTILFFEKSNFSSSEISITKKASSSNEFLTEIGNVAEIWK